MLQPQNLLMKRGTLPGKDPRVDQKVCTAIGFSDFAAAVSVIFSACCPAAVSDSETVFLCPFGSSDATTPPNARRWPATRQLQVARFSGPGNSR